jgi:hypothetical protein
VLRRAQHAGSVSIARPIQSLLGGFPAACGVERPKVNTGKYPAACGGDALFLDAFAQAKKILTTIVKHGIHKLRRETDFRPSVFG